MISSETESVKLLEKLNKVYPSHSYETYPEAIISFMLNESLEKVLGKNYNKDKISQRKEKKVYELFLSKVQKKYGPWVNICNFKIKKGRIIFNTNASSIYSNDKGLLFALCLPEDLYVTSHCLDRFEERIDTDRYNLVFTCIYEDVKIEIKAEPTSLDILRRSMVYRIVNMEYARKDDFVYFNNTFGVIVLKQIEDIYVAITFMTIEMMADKNLEWKSVVLPEDFLKILHSTENLKIKPFLDFETKNIQLLDTGVDGYHELEDTL